jgi:hypothetical protein
MSNWRHSFNLMSLLLIPAIFSAAGYLSYQRLHPMRHMSSKTDHVVEEIDARTSNGEINTGKFVPVSMKAYAEITERPLFVEGRLPPALPEKKASITRMPRKPLRLKLEGVAMMPDNRVAIIRNLDTNELFRVAQGMKKNDWKVESVESESATIIRKDERLVLKLELDNPSTNNQRQPMRKLPFRPSNR